MNTFVKLAAVSSLIVGGALFYLSAERRASTETGVSLTFYCAAGMKVPVSRIAEVYEDEYGVAVDIQYGGSGTLLSAIQAAQSGDLYLAADSSYTDIAKEEGIVQETIDVAYLNPVIAVPKGNPKSIEKLEDLWRDDVRTALGVPDAASIGKLTKTIMEDLGHWEALDAAVTDRGVFKPTVNEAANDVKIGSVDAAIVWGATVNTYPELEAVELPIGDDYRKTVTIGVLTTTEQPTAALKFARYLSARDQGLEIFAASGFPPVDGDVWEETPEIVYFSGGVNRLAIEDTLDAFAEREGIVIDTVYNGCGILVGQMKLGEQPDVYHSCDISFMRQVTDRFEPAVSLTKTAIVIAVQKGNPHEIATLADLGKEGLKVGLANEEQSALGELVARMLKAEGSYDAVSANTVSYTPTADLLVNQIRTGALDAVLVYEANLPYAREDLDVIEIPVDAAIATQTFAVSKNSKHKHLTRRLFDAIGAAESVEQFNETGFQWLGE